MEVRGARYRVQSDGTFHMADSHAGVAVKGGECFVPALGGVTVAGVTWVCETCGWRAAINHCPHCERSDLTRG